MFTARSISFVTLSKCSYAPCLCPCTGGNPFKSWSESSKTTHQSAYGRGLAMSKNSGKYGTAEKRWAGIGPYYAMFPVSFADAVIQQYTDKGDVVLDPFAGRATAVYSAAVQHRIGIGIELNPVGWVYGKTKLFPA